MLVNVVVLAIPMARLLQPSTLDSGRLDQASRRVGVELVEARRTHRRIRMIETAEADVEASVNTSPGWFMVPRLLDLPQGKLGDGQVFGDDVWVIYEDILACFLEQLGFLAGEGVVPIVRPVVTYRIGKKLALDEPRGVGTGGYFDSPHRGRYLRKTEDQTGEIDPMGDS
ncbi:hypothetical protein XA68_11484 [Ophiocordyceps unilateralis]|uniref:Uncharacterized protein n=1 Tax=Ophiocordyceps unilateralis TaxID=268505 RepID=A0A2A9PGZ0_OPHUN|nr:hypothetical protein XA68_11484 [Ophiocordyceps unilateralis]